MNVEQEFSKLYREAFRSSREWDEWFLSYVVPQGRIESLEVDDRMVSAMLQSPYVMMFHRRPLQMSYWSCVATARNERAKGYMSRLIKENLVKAAERGDAVVTLIPASRRLYFFYDRYGFASAFYVDTMRYTSLHAFKGDDEYMTVEPTYELFESLESMYPDGVRHSRDDFDNILTDLRIDEGRVLAVQSADGGAAMAFVAGKDTAVVKRLMATDDVAAESVLALLRAEVGDVPVVVEAMPGERSAGLQVRGMLRIVDAQTVLSQLAKAYPALKYTINLRDDIIESNNGIFRLMDGLCYRLDPDADVRKPDLDVSVKVLASILMSSPRIADVFGLPGARPTLDLMLE